MKHDAVSIIIPTLNEEKRLGVCLAKIRQLSLQIQIIVADGGSQDKTLSIAEQFGAVTVRSALGRGTQCNAGARLADQDILLFLHADTILPDNALTMIKEFFITSDHHLATFRLKFDVDHVLLRGYSFFTRFDSIFTRFGDQGIVVRKNFFHELGGFPEWPLFEDVHFLRLARRKTKVHSLSAYVTTSAERFLNNGFLRQQIFNAILILRYLMGQSPFELSNMYRDFKRTAKV